MTTRLPLLIAAAAIGAFLSSCAYDPYSYGYESGSSVAYSNNYGASNTVFIRTSNSRWGYDPYCRSYYDYTRQCYYDPYLNGYYPRGYRPPVIVGVPHPHGWRRGHGTCPPPRSVVHRNLNNYRNRHQQYCNLEQSWARDLRSRNHTPRHSNSIWNRSEDQAHNNRVNRGRANQDEQFRGRSNHTPDNAQVHHRGTSAQQAAHERRATAQLQAQLRQQARQAAAQQQAQTRQQATAQRQAQAQQQAAARQQARHVADQRQAEARQQQAQQAASQRQAQDAIRQARSQQRSNGSISRR